MVLDRSCASACPLGIVLIMLALIACSDDSGGGGGQDADDVTFDVASDTGGADVADQGGGDTTTGDGGTDASDDATEDPTVDAGDDAVSDADDDATGDLTDDIGFGDISLDQDPIEFPVCPYETASSTVNCETLCNAVVACGGEADSCEQFCVTGQDILNQTAANAFLTCVTETSCESVPEGQELGGYCFLQALSGLPANDDAIAACNAVDEAIETCLGEEDSSTFDARCGGVANALRSEADEELAACAAVACGLIEDCAAAAACDIFF